LKGEKMEELETQTLIEEPEKIDELPLVKDNISEVILSPIGITKSSHEESKKRKKMADKSRKINRRKQ
jgi:hypothetical protein